LEDILANIKQQQKRVKQDKKRRQANSSFKSSVKSALKSVNAAALEKNHDLALIKLSYAFKKLDKAAAKGVYHKNFVARHKSQLQLKVNALQ
jgi:small subunit ribosomal protein S20